LERGTQIGSSQAEGSSTWAITRRSIASSRFEGRRYLIRRTLKFEAVIVERTCVTHVVLQAALSDA
jgi:hypothetical protein